MEGAISDAAIELTAAQSRAAKIEANRRALAALLHHHGDRPPEQGCSAEARRIRREIRDAVRRSVVAPIVETVEEKILSPAAMAVEAGLRKMADEARPAILAIVDEVAAQYRVPVDLLLAPPRRTAQRSVERRAQLANREAMYRCYHEACRNYRALGLHFGKDTSAIHKAAALHVARIETGEAAR
jgi:hypothetical protein